MNAGLRGSDPFPESSGIYCQDAVSISATFIKASQAPKVHGLPLNVKVQKLDFKI